MNEFLRLRNDSPGSEDPVGGKKYFLTHPDPSDPVNRPSYVMPETRKPAHDDAAALETMKQARSAFEEQVREFRPELHRYCARMTGSLFDGEDIVQDTLAKAFYLLPQTRGIDNFRGWLFRIAHNKAIDHIRRGHRTSIQSLDDLDLADLSSPAEHPPMQVEEMATLGLAIFMNLTPTQRATVIFKDVLDHSLGEIAEILDCSVSSVKGTLHRGRAALRRMASTPQPEVKTLPPNPAHTNLLNEYVRHFTAGDFDALRNLLAEDVRLEVVSIEQSRGAHQVSNYFHRYSEIENLQVTAGSVEGRPAVIVTNRGIAYPILIESHEGKVTSIRDFRYARYIASEAT